MLIQNQRTLGYELTFQILSEFIDLSNRVVEGQHIELSWVENNAWDQTEQDYWQMCVQKTAWYTCITPCRLGALIGGAKTNELDAFIEIGMNLGVAFQLVDDALDYSARQAELGKTIGDDFSEGKITLPVILAFRRGNEEEKKFWKRCLEELEQHPDDLDRAQSLIKQHSTLDDTMTRARHYAALARDSLDLFSDCEAKQALISVIDFCIEREF